MDKIIGITGNSMLSIKPDVTNINLTFERVTEDYELAVGLGASDLKKVKEMLEKLGISKETVKITHFGVSEHTEWYFDDKGDRKYRKFGFEYHQEVEFSFKSDNDLLSKVFTYVTEFLENAQFDLAFSIDNRTQYRDKLLQMAVENAKEKAEVIADAAGVKIVGIQNISHSDRDSGSYRREKMCKLESPRYGADDCISIEIEPEDIILEDSIEVYFIFE